MVGLPKREARRPATMPTTPGCHPCLASTIARQSGQRRVLEHREGLGRRRARSTSLRRVQRSSTSVGEAAGLGVARGEEKRQGCVGLVEAARGVDARGEAEGHVLARGRAGVAARDVRERPGAGPRSAGEGRETRRGRAGGCRRRGAPRRRWCRWRRGRASAACRAGTPSSARTPAPIESASPTEASPL